MRSKFHFILLILGSISLNAFSQNVIKIHGYVYDSITNLPIELAHIFIVNTSVGTVTGKNGDFIIKIPTEFSGGQLRISSVGYRSKIIPISGSTNYVDIFLNSESLILKEVTISHSIDSGKFYLDKAIKMVPDNYPTKKHLLEAFYRELSIKDTSYTRLVEAAIYCSGKKL